MVSRALVVDATRHRTAVDRVYYSGIRETPKLVTPFLWVAVAVLRIVVVNEMGVADVLVERWMKRRIGEEIGKVVAWSHRVENL